MARIRTIKPAFFTSEDICKAQPLARLLFQGLWIEADRDGYLADSPFQLKTRILPADDCNVDELLWELAAANLIRRFTAANGRHYIQIPTFVEHQRPHPKEPKSSIPHEGTTRQRSGAVIRNGGDGMVPESIPPSPVGREGDLESGVLGREGKGTGTRQGLTTRGAFEANSLPRNHMRHALCGGQMRLCLSENVYGKFEVRYGGQPAEARKAIQKFVDALEVEHETHGDFRWLEDHFTAFLRRSGRLKDAAPARPNEAAPAANAAHDRKIRDMESGVYGR